MKSTEQARRGKARRISSIWLVPAVALAIGVWMAYDTVASRGPLVTLEMNTAEGIEAGKTLIKVKEVAVGRVESVGLSDDFSRAKVSARMFDGTEAMLNEESNFWVVKPRIGRDGISGLNTLLSGAYIELSPGNGDQEQRYFTTLSQPPVLRAREKGVSIVLQSLESNSLNPGDPVLYRGYTVGRVESADFAIEAQQSVYKLFIEDPFAELVTEQVRFWSSSGVQLELGSEGFRFDIGSLESLIAGGVSFDIVGNQPPGQRVSDGTEFQLFRSQGAARQEGFTQYANFLLYLDESVRGLSSGAPVEFRGIRVGTVIEVPYTGEHQLGSSLMNMKVPVLIRFEPERLGPQFSAVTIQDWQQQLHSLFEEGLRASLRSGNLLTGALYVDLNFHPNEPLLIAESAGDFPVFPTVRGGSGQLDQKVGELLDNVNTIDFGQFAATSEDTLRAIQQFATQLESLAADPDMQALPATLRQTLDELDRMMAGYSTDAPAYNDLSRAIERLDHILSNLEPFAESVRDKPSSLFFNSPLPADPEPRSEQ
ncbi:mammalian cell entry protein [Aliidiomarina minuta]|uniref:Mammalian cell entry protein n=1 Tax=Aliidiomarina minuta TaxID=880057 RepID=A0A432W9N5_9GAMM|nr:intermembrane transport protein PqiB [Aliidiomarina minuta]RUO26834.1 mammalian cell entry protein [Aliidiomarina minuta]